MTKIAIRVLEAASLRLDDIYRYALDRWGEAQVDRYTTGMFTAFEQIDTRGVMSRPVPAEFAVEGYIFRHERHFVYWRRLSNGDIGIVTIRHDPSRADPSDGSLPGGFRLNHCSDVIFWTMPVLLPASQTWKTLDLGPVPPAIAFKMPASRSCPGGIFAFCSWVAGRGGAVELPPGGRNAVSQGRYSSHLMTARMLSIDCNHLELPRYTPDNWMLRSRARSARWNNH